VGGFAGELINTVVDNAYSSGAVTSGTGDRGGFAGFVDTTSGGTITDSFYDEVTSGINAAVGDDTGAGTINITTVDPLGSPNALAKLTYTTEGWDFSTPLTGVWFNIDGETRPFLQMENVTDIRNAHQLQAIAMDLGGDYDIVDDIDLTVTEDPADLWAGRSEGFVPIGNSAFMGTFEGNNHVISNLQINRPSEDDIGLFGEVGVSGAIKQIYLENSIVIGHDRVGGLVGFNKGSLEEVSNVGLLIGLVTGNADVGGLIGKQDSSATTLDAFSQTRVTGATSRGGFVGKNEGTVTNSYSASSLLTGGGGFFGSNTGTIIASFFDEGLAGTMSGGIPKSTSEMFTQSTFDPPWNFSSIWNILDGGSYPFFIERFPDGAQVVNGQAFSDAGMTGLDGASI